VLRTAREPLALAAAARGACAPADPDQPVYEVRSVDELLAGQVAQRASA
jgi:hypothetical protein